MKADKREALLKRLDALESELEKRRVSMMTIARIAYHIWAIPGSAWASYEVANKLLNNVMQTVAEAKELEDQQRKLPHREPMKALSPPRVEQQPEKSGFANDLDDDIPF